MTETLRREKKGYYLSPETLERLRLVAARRDVARSRIVEEALEVFFRIHDSSVSETARSESMQF